MTDQEKNTPSPANEEFTETTSTSEKQEAPEKEKSQEKESNKNNSEFAIQRIYIKDISFETPNTPEVFQTKWEPEVTLDLDTQTKRLTEDLHEVILKITANVQTEKQAAFLIEVQQAGIFHLKAFADEQLHYMLGSFCPNILFPYVREVISEIVTRGGFPPLYLAPVNFDALYQQHLNEQSKKEVHSRESGKPE